MLDKTFKFGLYGLGIGCALIGLCMAILGSHYTATVFNVLLSTVYDGGPIQDLATPNIDSELSFYAVIFVFYGLVIVQTARNLSAYSSRVPYLLVIFLLAGLARLRSYIFAGQPHMLFMILMVIELILPILLYSLWRLSVSKF